MSSFLEALKASAARGGVKQALALGVALGVFACQASPTTEARPSPMADAAAKFAQAAAAVTGQTAEMADEYASGRHVGFDTYKYPGLKTMKIWKETPGSPY